MTTAAHISRAKTVTIRQRAQLRDASGQILQGLLLLMPEHSVGGEGITYRT